MKSIDINKETLYRLYITENKTQKEISILYDCNLVTILRKLQKYGIKSRKKISQDLLGQVFGYWTVLNRVSNYHGQSRWQCRCICGKESTKTSLSLLSGKSTKCMKCAGHEFVDLTGHKNKKITVLKQCRNNNRLVWQCQCDCGKIFYLNSTHVKQHSGGCKRCSGGWKGCGEISKRYFSSVRGGAESRNLEFNVTIEEIWQLFLQQDRKCAYSKLDLCFVYSYNTDCVKQTASLDRIDSSKGYMIDNVQWVHKDINKMKWSFSHEIFIDYCKRVVDNVG